MPDCTHTGFHSGQGRYNREAEALRYVIVCDDCQQELGEVGREAYRPQFDARGNEPYLRQIDALAVTRALRRGGVATLDALAARTGSDREALLWAMEDALARGWISASGPGCGDGICSTSAPTMYAVTERGRAAAG